MAHAVRQLQSCVGESDGRDVAAAKIGDGAAATIVVAREGET
ncbi:hypothetical protein [Acuticoccus mangrovi]|nr:hypothetical protein [Acuticoccus mangrovi]